MIFVLNFNYLVGWCGHGKPGKVMEFGLPISRLGEVMEIFKNVKSHGEWKVK